MDKILIRQLLDADPEEKIGILGDFCTDVYWDIRPDLGERSIETGLTTIPVGAARYSPGGAGNIAANLRGLGMKRILCFGAIGSDPFGAWLRKELCPELEKTDCLLDVRRKDYHTPVYCKPLLNGREQPRIDLGNLPLTDGESETLLRLLEKRLPELSVLIVNEQLRNGIHSEYFRRGFAALLQRMAHPPRIVFDGRDFLDAYPKVTLKINAEAASRLAFGHGGAAPEESGHAILKKTGTELVVTAGEHGCYVFERNRTTHIPAIRYDGPTDTVGAGDSFSAGFAFALAAGASMTDAAAFGNACSAVTIRKINQTGAPSPEELLSVVS